MKIKDFKATGQYVVLKAVPVEEETEVTTEGGIILSAEAAGKSNEGQKINAGGGKVRIKQPVVYSIGPKVNKEEMGFDIGDTVVYNDYDAQTFQPDADKEEYYILCKDVNIKAVIKTEE